MRDDNNRTPVNPLGQFEGMVKFLLEDNRKLQAADSFNKIFAFFRAVQVFRFTRVAVPLNARKTIPWRGKIIPDKPVDKNLDRKSVV